MLSWSLNYIIYFFTLIGHLMRRYTTALTGIILLILLGITAPASAVVVNFPDANLEAEVRDELRIPEPTEITDTDMATMGSLSAHLSDISNIGGLEYGTNLTDLNLGYNQISDISAVSGLTNLSRLYLKNNQISDISAVSGLTNLTTLMLGCNQISDISAVSGLTNLIDLDLGANQISDISAISGLTNLDRLVLDKNQISDISAVSGLTNLSRLHLDENQISDISAVSGLTNLDFLSLVNNQISDISAISGLTNLKGLYLSFNQISDISAVSGLTNLIDLHLRSNQISDISAVSGLTNLYSLVLHGNQIETMDLSNSDLSSLHRFNISDNPLTSVLLTDATLSQSVFNVLMDGGASYHTGIAELAGVSNLDMSGVDFTDIFYLWEMNTMDDLETLLLVGATNLDGSHVVRLTGELDSLNWLDVTELWDTFDAGSQSSLNAWNAIEGNTLVVPEPNTITYLFLSLAGLLSLGRRK